MLGARKYSYALFSILLLILISLSGSAISSDKVVIINSNDWHDRYLASIYAGNLDADILFFDNLGNAEIVAAISENKEVLLYESNNNHVVARYENYLKSNGVDNVKIIYYEDFTDLQFKLWKNRPNPKYIILDPDFGIEAVAAAPLSINDGFSPYFLTEENYPKVSLLLKNKQDDDVIVAGHFPRRFVKDLPGEKIIGSTINNTWRLTEKSIHSSSKNWGTIMSISEVDLSSLGTGIPIFVYYGDIDIVAEHISKTQIEGMDVIGSSITDIAREIKTKSKKDITLMVKYAKAFSNYPGLTGKLMEIDTIIMPFPYYSMVILGVEYFENEGKLSIMYHNNGYLPVNFKSQIEFAGQIIELSDVHGLLPGESVDIPFEMIDVFGDLSKATITTSYGQDSTLDKKIKDSFGRDVIKYDVSINSFEYDDKPKLEVISARLDDEHGIFYIKVANPNDYMLNVHGEMLFDDLVLPGSMINIDPNGEMEIEIPIEYLTDEDLNNKDILLTFAYGKEDTIFLENMKLSDVGKNNLFIDIGNDNKSGSISLFVILVLVILIFWFIRSRKKKKKENSLK